MTPDLHTNGDVLKDNDALCDEVKETYESIVLGLYDYETNEELEQAKQYWRQKLRGMKLDFSPIGLASGRSAYSIGIPRALVPSDKRMAVPDLRFANAPCHCPFIRLIIQYDGEMCNCCEDTQGNFNLGSVYKNSLEDLWFSDHHVHIVEQLLLGRREKYALCRNCPLPPTGPAPDGSNMEMSPRRYLLPKISVNRE